MDKTLLLFKSIFSFLWIKCTSVTGLLLSPEDSLIILKLYFENIVTPFSVMSYLDRNDVLFQKGIDSFYSPL